VGKVSAKVNREVVYASSRVHRESVLMKFLRGISGSKEKVSWVTGDPQSMVSSPDYEVDVSVSLSPMIRGDRGREGLETIFKSQPRPSKKRTKKGPWVGREGGRVLTEKLTPHSGFLR